MDTIQYYIFFAFVFLLYGVMKQITDIQLANKTGKVQYLYLVMFALWVLVGFRNVLYGRDTLGYVIEFQKKTSFSFDDVAEPLFHIFTYGVRMITDNYHYFLALGFLSTVVAMYKLFKRYFTTSYEIVAAICIYVLLGILAFNMAAMRQTLALSFAFFAFVYTDEGKWKQFLFCVIIAYFFHNSSFVLLIMYPLRYFDAKWYGFIVVGIVFLIGIIAPSSVVPFFQSYLPMEDRFTQYGTTYISSQNYTGFYLQLILVYIAFIRREYIDLPQKTKNLFFNMAYIGLAIQSLTMSIAELYRLSFYFCAFDMILVPIALSTCKGRYGTLLRFMFIWGCLIYIFILSGAGVLPIKQSYNLMIFKIS